MRINIKQHETSECSLPEIKLLQLLLARTEVIDPYDSGSFQSVLIMGKSRLWGSSTDKTIIQGP